MHRKGFPRHIRLFILDALMRAYGKIVFVDAIRNKVAQKVPFAPTETDERIPAGDGNPIAVTCDTMRQLQLMPPIERHKPVKAAESPPRASTAQFEVSEISAIISTQGCNF